MKYVIKNGLGNSGIAKIKDSKGVDGDTYDTVKELGKLIEISVSIKENTAKLYAGNNVILQDSDIGDIDVSITLPALSEEIEALIFGHKLAEGGGLIKSSTDVKPYFALQFEETAKDNETNENVTEYTTLFKGQFSQIERKGKTKEGTPQHSTVSLSGTFQCLDNGVYMYIINSLDEGFDTFKATFLKSIAVPKEKATE